MTDTQSEDQALADARDKRVADNASALDAKLRQMEADAAERLAQFPPAPAPTSKKGKATDG